MGGLFWAIFPSFIVLAAIKHDAEPELSRALNSSKSGFFCASFALGLLLGWERLVKDLVIVDWIV